jgi:hypothetical protein
MCTGWILVTNHIGFPIYKKHYRNRKEEADAEHTAACLLDFAGFRWARGETEEEVREKIADQIIRAKEAQNVSPDAQTD